jgi:uncharacterized protein
MISILSPAKTLDFESKVPNIALTQPNNVEASVELISKLRKLSSKKLAKLMHLSTDLADLNVMRFHDWSIEFDENNSRPAILAFSGEVYRGMENKGFSTQDLQFAQNHVRLLSGLHGVLRPLDLIQPYRLEMGTTMSIGRKKNLYQYWSKSVTESINQSMTEAKTDTLLNLASTEYSKVVDFKNIQGRVVTPHFKDRKGDEYKIVMTWAKLARGKMAGFIIRNRITELEHIKAFEEYVFSEKDSTDTDWVFLRG